jgi:hypothetical protein
MASQLSTKTNRRQTLPRMIGFCDATLAGARTPAQAIVIRDLSRKGLGARAGAKAPELGERVIVTIGSLGEMKAMVKWVSRDLFGLHFTGSLSRAQLESLRGV